MFRFDLDNWRRWLLLAGACLLLIGLLAYSRIGADRALRVDAAYPTQTKPQSKLWHAHGHWWAWLPDAGGSSVWKRVQDRWARVETLDGPLRDIPGYADVWADVESVTAVLVGEAQLTVAQLRYESEQANYSFDDSTVLVVDRAPIPCATITRDAHGHWWIAYAQNRSIWARRSSGNDVIEWDAPHRVAQGLDNSDLCVIVTLPQGVGVVWTDQVADALRFRVHDSRQVPLQWGEIETLAQGPKTANNHLNAAVRSDGTVYIVTKSSRYVVGEPILSLHVRRGDGEWESATYGADSDAFTPTRPIVLLTPDESELRLVHLLLDNSIWNRHRVVCRGADASESRLSPDQFLAHPARLDLRSATACKQRLPLNAPWIILASDRWGNVFEGQIPKRVGDSDKEMLW